MAVVTELVTNSLCHGPGKPIQVRIEIAGDGVVRGEVEDQGDGRVAIRKNTDGGAGGGLGLRIVDRFTDRWGVYEGSTHVWFEISDAKRRAAGLD
jgi:anti-sigma regulatory factor (Ser/Thr protein kinase)